MAENPSSGVSGSQGLLGNPAKPSIPVMGSGGPGVFKPGSIMMGKPSFFNKQSFNPPNPFIPVVQAPGTGPRQDPPPFTPDTKPPVFSTNGQPPVGSPLSGPLKPGSERKDAEPPGTSQEVPQPPVPANPALKVVPPPPKFGAMLNPAKPSFPQGGFNPSLFKPNFGVQPPKPGAEDRKEVPNPPSAQGPVPPKFSAGPQASSREPVKVGHSAEEAVDETRLMDNYSPVAAVNLAQQPGEVIVLGPPKWGTGSVIKPQEPILIKAKNEPPAVVPKSEGPAEALAKSSLFGSKHSSVAATTEAKPEEVKKPGFFAVQKPHFVPPQHKFSPLTASKGGPSQLFSVLQPRDTKPAADNEDNTEIVDPAKAIPIEVQGGQVPPGPGFLVGKSPPPPIGQNTGPFQSSQPAPAPPEPKKEPPSFKIGVQPSTSPAPEVLKQGPAPSGLQVKPPEVQPAPFLLTGKVPAPGTAPPLEVSAVKSPAFVLKPAPSAAPAFVLNPAPSTASAFVPNPAPSTASAFVPNPAPSTAPAFEPNPAPSAAPTFVPKPAASAFVPNPAPSAAFAFVPNPAPSTAPAFVPNPAPSTAPAFVPNPAPSVESKPGPSTKAVPNFLAGTAPPSFLPSAPKAGPNEAGAAVPNSAPSSFKAANFPFPVEEAKVPRLLFPPSRSQEQSIEAMSPAQVLRSNNVPPFPVPPELLEKLQVKLAQRNQMEGQSPEARRSETSIPQAEEKTPPAPNVSPFHPKQPAPAGQPSAEKAPLQPFAPRVTAASIPKVPAAPEVRTEVPQKPAGPLFLNPLAPPQQSAGPGGPSANPLVLKPSQQSAPFNSQPPGQPLFRPAQLAPENPAPAFNPPNYGLPRTTPLQSATSSAQPMQAPSAKPEFIQVLPAPVFNQAPLEKPGLMQIPSSKPGLMQAPSAKPVVVQTPSTKPGLMQAPPAASVFVQTPSTKPGASGFPLFPTNQPPKTGAKIIETSKSGMFPPFMRQQGSTQVQCMSCRNMKSKDELYTDTPCPTECKVCKSCLLNSLQVRKPLCCPVCNRVMGQEAEDMVTAYGDSMK